MKSAMAIQCLPRGGGSKEETYRVVDEAIAAIDKTGLKYTVCPMETVVEGPLDQLWEAAKAAHEAIIKHGGKGMTLIKLYSSEDLDPAEEKVAKYRSKGH